MRARRLGVVRGVVQGVGFRPHVARLAREESLGGVVVNAGGEVRVDAEGERAALARFASRLVAEAPAAARIDEVTWREAPATGRHDFEIGESPSAAAAALPLPPDLATCEDCRAEIEDPSSRRFAYPFTNCCACGPRFTITTALPYDRKHTTMAAFAMCPECRAEYGSERDRRYHAQPIACPTCGPELRLTTSDGEVVARRGRALRRVVAALRRGAIVALKGLGGYQLLCDAENERAVSTLRRRKRRPDRPFAVMVADIEGARALAVVREVAEAALTSAAAPIVLLEKQASRIAPSVAPRLARLGVMLPTTPLHHLILAEAGPVVCTSGNLHEEPIAFDDDDALARLRDVADLFVAHDRPIARRVDDGVVHVVAGRARTLRLGRGLGPTSLPLSDAGPPRLCLGAHLKNAPALSHGDRVVLWPHVGDLGGSLARKAFAEAVDDLARFVEVTPRELVTDLHPDYGTNALAERLGLPIVRVPHHAAHVAACLAEHGRRDALAFAWDGYGLGEDGGAWGGEVFAVEGGRPRRVASWRPFPLPGGDAAARDGRRALAGLFHEVGATERLSDACRRFVPLARRARISPRTSSVGRLFDAVAAYAGVRETSSYEGQAAMELEALAQPGAEPFPLGVSPTGLDFAPMIGPLVDSRDAVEIASRFHATLAHGIVRMSELHEARTVALAGGCFQNARLVGDVVTELEARGVDVLVPERVPPNDGGLALGQAFLAAAGERRPCV